MTELQNKRTRLTHLPNIGKVVAAQLEQVGIQSAEELRTVGAENAFIRLKTVDEGVCIRCLYGLEGAIQGIKDTELSKERKAELLYFYHMTKKEK